MMKDFTRKFKQGTNLVKDKEYYERLNQKVADRNKEREINQSSKQLTLIRI